MILFIFAALFAVAWVRQYTRLRDTPAYVLFPLLLAVYIPYSIVVLVPIDLMSSSQESHPLFYIGERARLIIWRVTYWLAFVLTWLILPVLQNYVESGYHDPVEKLRDSLKRNARYQMIIIGAGLVGLIYAALSSGLSLTSLKSLVIALSHCYALVLSIWLMAHGLVNIPRSMWLNSDLHHFLNHSYRHAVSISDQYAEAQSRYADTAAEITALAPFKDGTAHVEWLDDLIDDVHTGPMVTATSGRSRIAVDASMINDKYLPTLTYRFYQARGRVVRYKADWQKLLKECAAAEDIIKGKQEGVLEFRFSRTRLPPTFAALYYGTIRPYLTRALAAMLAAVSVILVWSEITHGTVASLVNVIISHTHGIVQQLISSFFLGYMCLSATSSLANIRVFNLYALVHRDSDYSSLLWYAMYICRLTVPLSYNYLTLVSSKDSVFEEFLGKSINLTPLGKYFNDWLPRLILVPVFLTAFHFYEKAKQYLGFGLSFDDSDDEQEGQLTGSIIEGRELVQRSLTDPRFRFALNPVDNHLPIYEDNGRHGYRDNSSGQGYSDNRQRAFGSHRSPSPPPQVGPLGNVKSFFTSIGSQVHEGVQTLSRMTRGHDDINDDADQPLVI